MREMAMGDEYGKNMGNSAWELPVCEFDRVKLEGRKRLARIKTNFKRDMAYFCRIATYRPDDEVLGH